MTSVSDVISDTQSDEVSQYVCVCVWRGRGLRRGYKAGRSRSFMLHKTSVTTMYEYGGGTDVVLYLLSVGKRQFYRALSVTRLELCQPSDIDRDVT